MSRSLLHDWEYGIGRCCRENLPCEMTEIAEDIYNTAYARGKNSVDNEVLDKIRATIENHCGLIKEDHCRYCSYCNSVMGVREILEIFDKYKTESESEE